MKQISKILTTGGIMDPYFKGFLIVSSLILMLLFLTTPAFGTSVIQLDLNRNSVPDQIIIDSQNDMSTIYIIDANSDTLSLQNHYYSLELEQTLSSVTLIEDRDNDNQAELLLVYTDETDEILFSEDIYQSILLEDGTSGPQAAVVTVAVSESADCTLNPTSKFKPNLGLLLTAFFSLLILLRHAKTAYAQNL